MEKEEQLVGVDEKRRMNIGVVGPDQVPETEAKEQRKTEEEAKLNGRSEEEGEAEEEDNSQDEDDERDPITKVDDEVPERIREFVGTTVLALPAERGGQRMDTLNLEIQVGWAELIGNRSFIHHQRLLFNQIFPQSPNGMILYAAGSDAIRRPKQKPPFMHSLELENARIKYTFVLGGEKFG